MKLNRTQQIMLIVTNMAKEENLLNRAAMAMQVIDLLKDNETERYLIEYYQGL